MKSSSIIWACRCSRCTPCAARNAGTELACSQRGDGNPAVWRGLLEEAGLRLSKARAIPKAAATYSGGVSLSLQHAIASVAVARSRCTEGNAQSLEDEAVAPQIEARIQLLESIGRLRELMMHERFGSVGLGRLHERRRRHGDRACRY